MLMTTLHIWYGAGLVTVPAIVPMMSVASPSSVSVIPALPRDEAVTLKAETCPAGPLPTKVTAPRSRLSVPCGIIGLDAGMIYLYGMKLATPILNVMFWKARAGVELI